MKSSQSRWSDGTLWLLLSRAVSVGGGAREEDEVVNGEKGAGELLVLLSSPIYGGTSGIMAEIVGSVTPTIQPLPLFRAETTPTVAPYKAHPSLGTQKIQRPARCDRV
jgi:hypothetical protein